MRTIRYFSYETTMAILESVSRGLGIILRPDYSLRGNLTWDMVKCSIYHLYSASHSQADSTQTICQRPSLPPWLQTLFGACGRSRGAPGRPVGKLLRFQFLSLFLKCNEYGRLLQCKSLLFILKSTHSSYETLLQGHDPTLLHIP